MDDYGKDFNRLMESARPFRNQRVDEATAAQNAQVTIAIKALKTPNPIQARIGSGGMTKEKARQILKQRGYSDQKLD